MIDFKVRQILKNSATLIEIFLDSIVSVDEAFSAQIPQVPFNKGVVISGRAPIWLYGRLIHHFHPARWIGVYDPRLGIVIVQSHVQDKKEGDVLEISL